jgi:hypothetical protein
MDSVEPPAGEVDAPPWAATRTPFWLLVLTLAGLAGWFLIRPFADDLPAYRPRNGFRTHDYWQLFLPAVVPYAGALWALRRGMRVSPALAVGAAAALYAVMIPAPAQQSQDVYQYLVYGRMALEGVSPYGVVPMDAPNGWLAFAQFDGTASVYGPLWTLASQLAVALPGGLLVAFVAIKVLTAGLAVAAAAGLARAGGAFAATAFALNPLVFASVGIGAHADVAVAAAFAWAVVAERRGKPADTTALLVAATLVKAYAGVALVAWLIELARRAGLGRAVAHGAAAAGVGLLAYLPYWSGEGPLLGLRQVGESVSASLLGAAVRFASGDVGSIGAGDSPAGAVGRIVAAAVMVGAAVWVARARWTRGRPWEAAGALFVVYLAVTPWFLYWHLLGPLAMLLAAGRVGPAVPALAFSGVALVVIAPPGPTTGSAEADLLVQTLLRYGIPLAAGAYVAARYTRRRAHSRGDGDRLPGRDRAPRGAGTAEGPRHA